ncbi:MAG: DUF362 domain-containing protein, partial [Bacteroidales bacterium]|nr:DUF362 domain-containing protein [Bacteroidales bacterium]
VVGRRNALKMLGLSSVGMLAGGFGDVIAAEPKDMRYNIKPVINEGRSSVSFTSGTDRRAMLYEVVKPFESELKKGLKNKQLIIKPNMVVTNVPLCATHVDALRALLEYLKPIYKGQIIIAESSSQFDSAIGFKNYGYLDLEKDFNIKFFDINTETKGKPYFILDRNMHLEKIEISDIFMDPNAYVISISRLKTHNSVVMTGGLKNIVMAAPLNMANGKTGISYKRNMHSGGSRHLHFNMYLVAQNVRPDFTIIDGVEGMQGDGPISGTPIEHRIAMAGFDSIAVDSMCARLMDIPTDNVGYLNYCDAAGIGIVDRNKIDIIGSEVPENHIKTYEMNRNITMQLEWKDPLPQPARPGQPGRPASGQAPQTPQK